MSDPNEPNHIDRPPAPTITQRPLREQKWAIVMAACIAGMMIGYGLSGFVPKTPDWKRDATQHHSLYREWTVFTLEPDIDKQNAEILKVSMAIRTSLPVYVDTEKRSLLFKRAQLLGFGDASLAQVFYTEPNGTPVSLFALERSRRSKWSKDQLAFEASYRSGFASATWATATADFLMVGGDDIDRITRYADGVIVQLLEAGEE